MPRVKHHRSSRRVPPPKDSDFDHEINLVDHSPSPRTSDQEDRDGRASSRGTGAGPSSAPNQGPPDAHDAADGLVDGVVANGTKKPSAHGLDRRDRSVATEAPSVHIEEPTPQPEPGQPTSGDQIARSKSTSRPMPKPKTPESAIDILYENQRGGFLCGIALFSSKALGNLDPPAWTNFAHKPSPTDIHTAQVPDPSWEWAWPEWRINHEDGVDEEGWEYSFAFYRKFSWHKASWWNSFVRRRAWIRKRVKKDSGYAPHDPNMLNLEYFSIRASAEMERSPSRVASPRGSRLSMSTANNDDQPPPDIEYVETLLQVLREARIDREKIDAVDNYLDHAEDELAGLQDAMHDIMASFVFQASRRALLTRLTEVYDKAVEEREKRKDKGMDGDANVDELDRRVDNLSAAVKHADEEVRRLEYWSDVKGAVAEGDSKGGVDERQGWDPGWQGLDRSGPKAPILKHADEDGSK